MSKPVEADEDALVMDTTDDVAVDWLVQLEASDPASAAKELSSRGNM